MKFEMDSIKLSGRSIHVVCFSGVVLNPGFLGPETPLCTTPPQCCSYYILIRNFVINNCNALKILVSLSTLLLTYLVWRQMTCGVVNSLSNKKLFNI